MEERGKKQSQTLSNTVAPLPNFKIHISCRKSSLAAQSKGPAVEKGIEERLDGGCADESDCKAVRLRKPAFLLLLMHDSAHHRLIRRHHSNMAVVTASSSHGRNIELHTVGTGNRAILVSKQQRLERDNLFTQ